MANLYEDANWSQKYLEEAIKEARKQVTKNKICCFSLDCLKYYYNDLMERTKEGHNTSFIDLWGLLIESMLHDKVLLFFFPRSLMNICNCKGEKIIPGTPLNTTNANN